MSEVVSDVVVVPAQAGHPSDGFESIASLSDGFLGTGYPTSVELSFLAMGLIAGYVAYSTVRYFLAGTRVLEAVAETLGLRGQ